MGLRLSEFCNHITILEWTENIDGVFNVRKEVAEEIGKILTVEEQQLGGFGNIVAGVIAQNKKFSKSFVMDMVEINNHFGDLDNPRNLLKAFGLSAEQIAVRAKKLFDI